jgi:hypothetical protein
MAFTQEEVFPTIFRMIVDYAKTSDGYMEHGRIIAAILNDKDMRRILDGLSTERSPSEWAGIMVAGFTQRIKLLQLSDRRRYERVQINGRWAYRAKQQEPA